MVSYDQRQLQGQLKLNEDFGTGGEVHKCRLKCPSSLNTSFIVGNVDLGACSAWIGILGNFFTLHVNLQPSPANTILQNLSTSHHSHRKLHRGMLLHGRLCGGQPMVC